MLNAQRAESMWCPPIQHGKESLRGCYKDGNDFFPGAFVYFLLLVVSDGPVKTRRINETTREQHGAVK